MRSPAFRLRCPFPALSEVVHLCTGLGTGFVRIHIFVVLQAIAAHHQPRSLFVLKHQQPYPFAQWHSRGYELIAKFPPNVDRP